MTDQILQSDTPSSTLIEIGLIIMGNPDPIDLRAITATRQQLEIFLSRHLPSFQWQFTTVLREDVPTAIRNEPAVLLQDGSQIRDSETWDFALIYTSADLLARYKPYALSVISSALDLAVISTSRIDPHVANADVDETTRADILTDALFTLSLHAIGHLNGLNRHPDNNNFMHALNSPSAIPAMQQFTDTQKSVMRDNLQKIADQRLEESESASNLSDIRFYLQSAWMNRHEIAAACWHAKPWEFPMRLMRLSAAALSTLLILLMTAETWHLAIIQSIPKLSIILLLVLLITSGFIALRQRLFIHRHTHPLSEQTVITNVSSAMIVITGMLTTTIALLVSGLIVSTTLYSPALIESWTASAVVPITLSHYWLASLLVTTLGLVVGALGASFEDQYYFRHVVFVDEET